MRPRSFLKDAKPTPATFGRHRINISPRQSRYTNLRAPGTKKGRHPSGYLHHFNHYHYRRDDDGQQYHHHPKKEPEECGGLLLFGGFVTGDDLSHFDGLDRAGRSKQLETYLQKQPKGHLGLSADF